MVLLIVSSVYFSTEGVYRKLNPNVLYDTISNNFLIDKYDIVYIDNVEDLCLGIFIKL